jgi:GNAT superfamily N-acetyltransferase
VKTRPELVSAANLNYVGSYRKLVEHSANGEIREVGGVFAFATGLPISLFNGCVVVAPASAAELEAALEWVNGRGLPYRIWIDEAVAPGLGDVALAHGLQRDVAPYPGMVLHPAPEPPAPSPGVTVVPVTNAGLAEYHEVCVEDGLPPELAYRLFPASFATDPDVQLFTARLEERPVGTSVAIRTGDVAGVYAVSTLPTARRRGVGTAATWAAVAAGRAWGCDTIVLQASEMGFSLYAAMGFQTVVPYATFRHPPADPLSIAMRPRAHAR